MRGRPPKPTAIKLVEGAFTKDPQRRNHGEPKPSGQPTPTEPLDGNAAAAWERIVPPLIELGVVGESDSAMLTLMVWHYTNAWNADLSFRDRVLASDKFRQIAEQYGMTAAARSRLDVRQSQPKSDLEKLMA